MGIIPNITDLACGVNADYQQVYGHDRMAGSAPECSNIPGVTDGLDAEGPAVETDWRNILKQARSFLDSQFKLLDVKNPIHETTHTQEVTTLMICDLPCRLTVYEIIDTISCHGFADTCNLLYMPSKYPKFTYNMGYAFVNF